MDRTFPCEGKNSGSTPDESTSTRRLAQCKHWDSKKEAKYPERSETLSAPKGELVEGLQTDNCYNGNRQGARKKTHLAEALAKRADPLARRSFSEVWNHILILLALSKVEVGKENFL